MSSWEFFAAFAAEFGTHAAIVEIDMGIACTQYVEPCIHQLGSQTNVNSLIAAGYSEALDVAAFVAGWGIFSRTWAPYRVAGFTSYNPPGAVNVAAGTGRQGGNMAKAISLMETQMAMLGGLTVLASESLSNLKPTDGGDYQTLYARQVLARNATPPTIIRYQTETYGNLAGKYALGASVQATIESAISLGATTAEIPVGCENPNPQPPPASPQPLMYVSPSAAAAYNTRFRANLIGLT